MAEKMQKDRKCVHGKAILSRKSSIELNITAAGWRNQHNKNDESFMHNSYSSCYRIFWMHGEAEGRKLNPADKP
jgi:hypothetical protein